MTPELDMAISKTRSAIAIYEVSQGRIDILRVNGAFYRLFNYDTDTNIMQVEQKSYTQDVFKVFADTIESQKDVSRDYERHCPDGSIQWIHIETRYISKVGERHIIFGRLQDITAQKELEQELESYGASAVTPYNSLPQILVVDDAEINRILLKEIFRGQYEVLEACNGQEAFAVLEAYGNKVKAILLDLIMPVMDGKEFLLRKNADDRFHNIPVIIITADGGKCSQLHMLELGVNDYIIKPFVNELVKRRVANVIEYNGRFQRIVEEYQFLQQKSARLTQQS